MVSICTCNRLSDKLIKDDLEIYEIMRNCNNCALCRPILQIEFHDYITLLNNFQGCKCSNKAFYIKSFPNMSEQERNQWLDNELFIQQRCSCVNCYQFFKLTLFRFLNVKYKK